MSAAERAGERIGDAAKAPHRQALDMLRAAGLARPLLLLASGIAVALAIASALALGDGAPMSVLPWLLAVQAMALLGLLLAGWRLWRYLLKPLAALEGSVGRLCQGETGATSLPPGQVGVLGSIVRDIDSLGEELTDLYEDMDNRVARQTNRLAQKTASLKILYDAAASINHADDLNALLLRFLRVLTKMVNGRAASVRLLGPDGHLRLVGCIGLDGELVRDYELLPVQLCRCGKALSPGDILCTQDAAVCSKLNGRRMFGDDEVEPIEVALEYHEERLGMYRFFVDKPGVAGREDIMELLSTIGSHLGMAVAKQRSDAEARRLSIIEERNHLAHELHDSLAQTLASLRFQVRMLQETLEQGQVGERALYEVRRMRKGLDEAHTELRELLTSFRAPVGQRGLIPALEKLAGRFRQETGIPIFFQRDCRQLDLRASEETQLLRIVQEALANVRKHARAHTVRVLLRCQSSGTYMLLVEDDGMGYGEAVTVGVPGEHIGISVMEERAQRLGADFRIESEPGEGTRVEVIFNPGGRLGRTASGGTA